MAWFKIVIQCHFWIIQQSLFDSKMDALNIARNYRQSTGLDLRVNLQKNLLFNKRLNNFAA